MCQLPFGMPVRSICSVLPDVTTDGGLAQMVERSLSMREVPGSIPGFSTFLNFFF